MAWTPWRYAVYLQWIRQAAADISRHAAPEVVSPDLLELTLFDLDASALPARRQDSAVATDHTDGYDDGEATDW